MKIIKILFYEPDKDHWSWRRFITFVILFIFTWACFHWMRNNKTEALPDPYIMIIAGVITFYFGKKFMNFITEWRNGKENK